MRLINTLKQGNLNILVRIVLSYCLFIALIYILNRNNDRLTSFIIVNFSALVALAVLSFRLKNKFGFNVMRPIFIGYFIKLLIGYLFWEFYLYPDYFSNTISFFKFNHSEYLYTELLMKNIASERIAEGFFYFSPQTLMIKHSAIHYFMSNLYLSGSFNPFDIAVQNGLFSAYTAMIVLTITKHFGVTSKQMRYALLIAIYQPFSMISSIIWRDVVGQFFVALGGYLTVISLTKKTRIAVIFLLIASFVMLMQRSLYFFFPVLAYTAFLIVKSRNLYRLLFLPVIIVGLLFINNQFNVFDDLGSQYGSNLTGVSLWIFLPLNIIRLFVGPFPWTQWFNFNDNTIFQIADYFQSVVSITLVILSVKIFSKKRLLNYENHRDVLLLVFLFIPFVLSALGTVDIHQGYMTTGSIFLIPLVVLSSQYLKFIKINLIVLIFFICANILFLLLGLSGAGSGALFR